MTGIRRLRIVQKHSKLQSFFKVSICRKRDIFVVPGRFWSVTLTFDCESAPEGDFGAVLGAPSRDFWDSKVDYGDDVLGVDFLAALAWAAEADPPSQKYCLGVP